MQKSKSSDMSHKAGFTLIELSIVLVIIGLIVGGILVGQDLIKAAQLRATVTQFERYDATVNTFRTKYNGLPGDLTNCVNFFAAADCATTGTTAGNNTLEDAAGTRIKISGEVAAFFHQLYTANMIGEAMTDTAAINANVTPVTIANAFPAAKIGSANYIMAITGGPAITQTGMSSIMLYRLGGLTSAALAVPTTANNLTPLEAFSIDSKKDDGAPNTGAVQATDNVTAANFNQAADTYVAGANSCVTAAPAYNTSTTNGNSRLCQLIIRSSF